ncbi:MAG: Trm112 family protein [Acidimicrobiia bacterium]|nr:Trm112 family protein [Acidimicrobiia bacterium]
MVDPEILEILACPETKTPVRLADPEVVRRLNRAIEEGEVLNRGGQPVTDALEEALIREDGLLIYPVRDDIPIMLVDEAIPLDAPAT